MMLYFLVDSLSLPLCLSLSLSVDFEHKQEIETAGPSFIELQYSGGNRAPM